MAALAHSQLKNKNNCAIARERSNCRSKVLYAVAVALLHVCDRRLYRESFRTFEIYCRKRWEMRSTYAYDLIHFARLLSEFSANADIKILPKLEGQTRSLAALLNAADRATVWRRALEVARGGQITGKIVTRARQEFWMENPERAPTRLRTAQNSPLSWIRPQRTK